MVTFLDPVDMPDVTVTVDICEASRLARAYAIPEHFACAFPTKIIKIVCILTSTCSLSRLFPAAPFLIGRLLASSAV